jgi:hypothetical protein
MLSVFPDVLFLAPFAAFFLRVAAALFFGYAAWSHLKSSSFQLRVLGIGEALVAVALFFGAWAQAGALLGAIIAAIWLFQPSTRATGVGTAALLLVISFALILTGPGPLAFDLPL